MYILISQHMVPVIKVKQIKKEINNGEFILDFDIYLVIYHSPIITSLNSPAVWLWAIKDLFKWPLWQHGIIQIEWSDWSVWMLQESDTIATQSDIKWALCRQSFFLESFYLLSITCVMPIKVDYYFTSVENYVYFLLFLSILLYLGYILVKWDYSRMYLLK